MNNTRRRFLKTGILGGVAAATGCTTDVSVDEEVLLEVWRPLKILILGGTALLDRTWFAKH